MRVNIDGDKFTSYNKGDPSHVDGKNDALKPSVANDFEQNLNLKIRQAANNADFGINANAATLAQIAKSNVKESLGGLIFAMMVTNGGRNIAIKSGKLKKAKTISDKKIQNLPGMLAEEVATWLKTLFAVTSLNREVVWEMIQTENTILCDNLTIEDEKSLDKLVNKLCNTRGLKICGINKGNNAHRTIIRLAIILRRIIKNEQLPPECFQYVANVLNVPIIIAYAVKQNRRPGRYEIFLPDQNAPIRFKTSRIDGAITYDPHNNKEKEAIEKALEGGMYFVVHNGKCLDAQIAAQKNLIPDPINYDN